MFSQGFKNFLLRIFPIRGFIPCPVLLFEARERTVISTNHLDIGRFYIIFGFWAVLAGTSFRSLIR